MAHPAPSVYKSAADTHKTIYFTLAIAVNLLGVACLLIAWNAKDFSVVSTAPAGSPGGHNTDDTSMLNFATLPSNNNPSNTLSHSQQPHITTTTCTGDSLELSLESAFVPSSRSSPPSNHSNSDA
uniref:Uncharacterized protein n=1 Tax=Panagrolaimus sp. ES5 TaxID=591445 RepID=A0AC34F8X3_9BILA